MFIPFQSVDSLHAQLEEMERKQKRHERLVDTMLQQRMVGEQLNQQQRLQKQHDADALLVLAAPPQTTNVVEVADLRRSTLAPQQSSSSATASDSKSALPPQLNLLHVGASPVLILNHFLSLQL
jgi:ubiquinone biosynthesis protein Coq4